MLHLCGQEVVLNFPLRPIYSSASNLHCCLMQLLLKNITTPHDTFGQEGQQSAASQPHVKLIFERDFIKMWDLPPADKSALNWHRLQEQISTSLSLVSAELQWFVMLRCKSASCCSCRCNRVWADWMKMTWLWCLISNSYQGKPRFREGHLRHHLCHTEGIWSKPKASDIEQK